MAVDQQELRQTLYEYCKQATRDMNKTPLKKPAFLVSLVGLIIAVASTGAATYLAYKSIRVEAMNTELKDQKTILGNNVRDLTKTTADLTEHVNKLNTEKLTRLSELESARSEVRRLRRRNVKLRESEEALNKNIQERNSEVVNLNAKVIEIALHERQLSTDVRIALADVKKTQIEIEESREECERLEDEIDNGTLAIKTLCDEETKLCKHITQLEIIIAKSEREAIFSSLIPVWFGKGPKLIQFNKTGVLTIVGHTSEEIVDFMENTVGDVYYTIEGITVTDKGLSGVKQIRPDGSQDVEMIGRGFHKTATVRNYKDWDGRKKTVYIKLKDEKDYRPPIHFQ